MSNNTLCVSNKSDYSINIVVINTDQDNFKIDILYIYDFKKNYIVIDEILCLCMRKFKGIELFLKGKQLTKQRYKYKISIWIYSSFFRLKLFL